MISKKIVDTDLFLDMPVSSRLLYYDLLIRADDDGFVGSPKKITKMVGASDDDLKILVGKRFLIPFDSGVCVIRDWRIHNYIKNDRYTQTQYIAEKGQLMVTQSKAYEKKGEVIPAPALPPGGFPGIEPPDAPEIIDAPEKPKRHKSELTAEQLALFEKFYSRYPKKVDRGTAERAWAHIKADEATTDRIIEALEGAKKYDSRFTGERQYIPNPASWLNAKGYLNDYGSEAGPADAEHSGNPDGFSRSVGFNRRTGAQEPGAEQPCD